MARERKKANARGMNHDYPMQAGWPFTAPEHQPLLKLLLELTEMWYNAARKLTLYGIDVTEGVAKGVIEGHRLVNRWARDTPVASLLEEQQAISHEFVVRSADLARRLWLLQIEQGEVAAKRAEEELLPLDRAQA